MEVNASARVEALGRSGDGQVAARVAASDDVIWRCLPRFEQHQRALQLVPTALLPRADPRACDNVTRPLRGDGPSGKWSHGQFGSRFDSGGRRRPPRAVHASDPGGRDMSGMEKCSIEFEGSFDAQAARMVEEALDAMRPGGALRVDLTRVREFNNVGLAILARSLARSRESLQVDVRGLGYGQHRMLRYFGAELASDDPFPDDALP